MNEEKFNIEQELTDVILGKPYKIAVGEGKEQRFFFFFPVTLAKKLWLQSLIESLCIDMKIMVKNPYLETLRIAHENKHTCCQILAYHTTPNTKKAFYDIDSIDKRREFFEENLGEEDIATLLVVIFTADKTKHLKIHLGLDKEQERMEKVMEVKRKHGKNNIMFGGKSLCGTFIGQLKEMGYSDDAILFRYGFSYLSLMLADKITSIYLSDEELNELPTSVGGTMLDGNDPASKAAFMAQLKKSGVDV